MSDSQRETDFWAASNKTETLKGELQVLNHVHILFHIKTYRTKFRIWVSLSEN